MEAHHHSILHFNTEHLVLFSACSQPHTIFNIEKCLAGVRTMITNLKFAYRSHFLFLFSFREQLYRKYKLSLEIVFHIFSFSSENTLYQQHILNKNPNEIICCNWRLTLFARFSITRNLYMNCIK